MAVPAFKRDAAETLLAVNNIEVIYNKAVQVLRGLSLAVPDLATPAPER